MISKQVAARRKEKVAAVADACGCRVGSAGAALAANAAFSQPVPPETQPKKKLTVEEWRAVPSVSVSDRLEYETKRALAQEPPALTPEAKKRLDYADQMGGGMARGRCSLLHSQQAEQIVQREGFGRGRMPRPSTRNLTLPSAPTITRTMSAIP